METKRKEAYDQQLKELEDWKEYCKKPQHELIAEIFSLREEIKKLKNK